MANKLLEKIISEEAKKRLLGGDTFYIRSSGRHSAFFPSVVRALITGKPYRPRAMMIFGSNPLSTARNPMLIKEALSNLEFLVVVDVARTTTSRFADIEISYAEVGNQTAKLDLLLNLEEYKTGIAGWFEYNTHLFDEDTICAMNADYIGLVQQILTDPQQKISDFPVPLEMAKRKNFPQGRG